MKINLKRYSDNGESTLGLLFIDCKFVCYTIEDEARNKKVYGETRIPEGVYKLGIRDVGGFHNRYLNKFGKDFHKGMIQIMQVPDFEYILLHIGNDDDDTAGCILVGDSANNNTIADGFISSSTNAYKRIYPEIIKAVQEGDVYITIETL